MGILSLPTSFRSGYGIEMPTYVFRILTGFHSIAQGCGTPLPWVANYPHLPQRGYVTSVQLPCGKTDVTPLE
ncbi:MAG: hypothetical protein BWY09_02336 [Candidatus Hydrogenedentes bacterium ADurb.Bin179]|nr:MAG: hypothetical protein BWY09_02336 [Candidatus Hydrogenedentes bacterium ADurb.Bin179]